MAAVKKPSVVWLYTIGIVFGLIGLAFVWLAVHTVRTDLAARDWPQAEARLTEAEVLVRIREGDADDNYVRRESYFEALTYAYTVDGETFPATVRVEADTRAKAAERVADRRPGEVREVYYDPADPHRYRFEPASAFGGLVWLLPFLVFAGFGWAVIRLGAVFAREAQDEAAS